MTRKHLTLCAVAALLVLTLWLSRPASAPSPAGLTPASKNAEPSAASTSARAAASQAPNDKLPADAYNARLYPEAARALNASTSDIRADLRALDELISTYRSNFARLGNPVGSNAEITAALTGKNKLRLGLLPSNHSAINAQGELCDRWGTPFFFHAESATRMGIRSAGPDKKMWNEDDVAFEP